MKITLLSMLFCFTVSTVFSQNPDLSKKKDEAERKSAGAKEELTMKIDTLAKMVYTCPMHTEVIQDKAGKCPTCGMNLEHRSVAKTVYTCPMHAEVTQGKAGKCPQCKMNLVMKEPTKKEKSKKK